MVLRSLVLGVFVSVLAGCSSSSPSPLKRDSYYCEHSSECASGCCSLDCTVDGSVALSDDGGLPPPICVFEPTCAASVCIQ